MLEALWASFEGKDVCPQCQSPEERRDVRDRVIRMIEREIDRRQRDNLPSDPYEAPLVAHAMTLREDADEYESIVTTDPSTASKPTYPPDHTRLRVAITGAFLTGHPLTIRFDAYHMLQRELGAGLSPMRWRVERLYAKGGTYESGGGFSEAVPLIIACREGADLIPWLSSALNDVNIGARGRNEFAPILAVTAKNLTIDVYDLGVAVMAAEFEVIAPRTRLQDTARAVKRLIWLRPGEQGPSPLAAELGRIAAKTADEYARAVVAVKSAELPGPWLSRSSLLPAVGAVVDRQQAEQGRLLWLHPVHVLHTANAGDDAADELAPSFCKRIDLADGIFTAGIGWSTVVVPPGSDAASTPVRLTKLHWAYYALFMEIDRGLLEVLNQQRWSKGAPLKQLEDDADDVFADYLRVMSARARLDTELSSLGGDELAIWETIAKVQRFDTLVKGVECKLDVLDKVAERRVELANADRDRRIGIALGGLTALTFITLVGGVIGVVAGAVDDPNLGGSWGFRTAVLTAALIIAIVFYWQVFFRYTRPSTSRRHRVRTRSTATYDRGADHTSTTRTSIPTSR